MRYLLASLLVAPLFACGGEGTGSRTPNAGINVILLTIDTLRPDHMSAYGYQRQTTPAIDQLAARGVVFERAYTYWPKTRASFASMFTSLYASQNGLNVRDRDLPDFNQTLAEVLQEAGYRTAAAVDNGNLDGSLGFAQGFDQYDQAWLKGETEIERTEVLTQFAVDFLAKGEEADTGPFFLWIHYVNPHAPYDPPEEILKQYRNDDLVPRGPQVQPVVGYHGGVNRKFFVEGETHLGDYIDRYDGEVTLADQHIGRVIDALDNSPYRSSTLVILASDHGESLGEHDYYFDHGFNLFNPSLHIPLILSFPGILPEGERNNAMVSTLDVYPTILDLAQVSFPPQLEGQSLVPLINRNKDELHEKLLFQNEQHHLGITNGRLKLIAYPRTEESKRRYELYDTSTDAGELTDLYSSSGQQVSPFRAELERFRTQTVAWQQETTRRRMGAPPTTDDELSPDTLRNLEALGYVGGTSKKKEQ